MNNTNQRGLALPRRVTLPANIIFVLSMIGVAVYSFVNPDFGLSWGWIVIVISPIWAFMMANISAG